MTAYPCQTWTTLGQLCAALLDSQSRPGCDTAWIVKVLSAQIHINITFFLDRCAKGSQNTLDTYSTSQTFGQTYSFKGFSLF